MNFATSDFLQRATSVRSNERILQRVTSDFTMSNEQRVKSYASLVLILRYKVHDHQPTHP